jgi:hypothetical protein
MSEWVINLSGKRGKGPWLSKKTGGVHPTPNFQGATRADSAGLAGIWRDTAEGQGYPDAKVFRLGRKRRYRAEEDAVVEAAMVYTAPNPGENPVTYAALDATCAHLRAKRGK